MYRQVSLIARLPTSLTPRFDQCQSLWLSGANGIALSLSFANNRSEQQLLCCNAFISVMKTAELWNCDNLSNTHRFSMERTLLGEA
jgi:hypothetical protein